MPIDDEVLHAVSWLDDPSFMDIVEYDEGDYEKTLSEATEAHLDILATEVPEGC